MVRYFYGWIPIVFIGTLLILSLPWLGLIALILVLPFVGAVLLAIVCAPYWLGRAIVRRWHGRRDAWRSIDDRTPQRGPLAAPISEAADGAYVFEGVNR